MSKTKPTNRTDERRERREADTAERKRDVDRLIQKHAPALWAKQANAGIREDQVDAIMTEIGADRHTRELAKVIEILRGRLRSLGRKTKGSIYLPLPAATIERDASPYREHAVQSSVRLARLHEEFLTELSNMGVERPAPEENMDETNEDQNLNFAIGRILYSAVVNGGLLETSFLWRLPQELVGQPVACGHMAWITFEMKPADAEVPDKQPTKAPAVRRWIVDYVSLGLIARLVRGRSPEDREKFREISGSRALSVYLTHLQKESPLDQRLRISPKGKGNSFLEAAAIRLSYTMPPVVIRYLTKKSMGESMSEDSWWRYHFGRKQEAILANSFDEQGEYERVSPVDNENVKTPDLENLHGVHQQRMASLLKRCFRKRPGVDTLTTAEALRNVTRVKHQHSAKMAPLVLSIFQWFEFLLSQTSRAEQPITVSSAETYRSRIVQPMIDTNWEFDTSEDNPEEWEEFYADVLIEITAPVQRQHAITTVRMFHRFLMASIGAPPAMIEGGVEEGSRIRNSILSEEDFSALRDYMHSVPSRPYMTQLLEVVSILMFRAGLRPNDIVGLRFRHISGASLVDFQQETVYPVLYLRSTTQNSLKTPAAVRQIPLPWLVPDDELKLVTDFVFNRLQSCRANGMNESTAWVFAGDWNSDLRMNSSRHFAQLSKLLKQITGDPEVSSYNLRHSFLSNWIHKILTGMLQDPEHPMFRSECLPREILYTVSIISAHESPKISFGTYIHTMDMVAFHFIQKGHSGLTDSVRAAVELRSGSTVTNRRADQRKRAQAYTRQDEVEYGYKNLVGELSGDLPPLLSRTVYEGLPEKLTAPSTTDLELPELFRVVKYLAHHGEHSVAVAENIFSLPEKEIISLRRHGRELGGLLTNARSGKRSSRSLPKAKPGRVNPATASNAANSTRKWAANRSPDDIAPALPRDHAERDEAGRVFRLLITRSEKLGWSSVSVNEEIIDTVRNLLERYSVSERAFRVHSEAEFKFVLKTLKWLNIHSERIRVKVESIPGVPETSEEAWYKALTRMAPLKSLHIQSARKTGISVSRDFPHFGVCLIQVMGVAQPEPLSSVAEPSQTSKASKLVAASWRVGCYYAAIAILARLDTSQGFVD